jgi:ornithine cyclodeaminase
MSFLALTNADIKRLLTMQTCIDLVAEVLADLVRDRVHQPLRMVVSPDDSTDLLALMPAHRSAPGRTYGIKALCAFPDNTQLGLEVNQGAVLLFDGRNGALRSVMNAASITAIRTAAVSGVATRLLANEDTSELAILGAGVQARSHVEAMLCVRPFDRIRVWSRTYERSTAFADEIASCYSMPVEPTRSPETAVRGADVVVTATAAVDPILECSWVDPGAHVNAVGSASPETRELDTATIASAALFVDQRTSALNEAGDLLMPLSTGAIRPDHIRAELGEVLLGLQQGRVSADEVTVFKSVGLAVEDLAAAEYLLRRAQETGSGITVDF